jgi:hypothetical protein
MLSEKTFWMFILIFVGELTFVTFHHLSTSY